MIVLINGPLGVGKTDTAWALLELYDRAVMLDGDFIGAVHPFEIYDSQRLIDLFDTLHLLVEHYQKKGYPHAVINYVFETPDQMAALRKRMAEIEPRICAYRLTCGRPSSSSVSAGAALLANAWNGRFPVPAN